MVFGYGSAIDDAMKLMKIIEDNGFTVEQFVKETVELLKKERKSDKDYWDSVTDSQPTIETIDFDKVDPNEGGNEHAT